MLSSFGYEKKKRKKNKERERSALRRERSFLWASGLFCFYLTDLRSLFEREREYKKLFLIVVL